MSTWTEELRQRVLDCLGDAGEFGGALLEEFEAAHAHELAEKIRVKCRELYGSPNALRPGRWADEGYGLLDAADLIDPEED